jgi:hypothetical protein
VGVVNISQSSSIKSKALLRKFMLANYLSIFLTDPHTPLSLDHRHQKSPTERSRPQSPLRRNNDPSSNGKGLSPDGPAHTTAIQLEHTVRSKDTSGVEEHFLPTIEDSKHV